MGSSNRAAAILFLIALLVASVGGAPSHALATETTGERFRKVLAGIESWCREIKVGPYLDPKDPEYQSKRRATDCDILALAPRDLREVKFVKLESQPHPVPEHWLATPEGRFAHSIRLPAPHDRSKDIYQPGMSSGQYFQALCQAESGDFVFRAIDNVEGVVRLRLPEVGTDNILRHLFATESTPSLAIGHVQTKEDSLGEQLVQPPHGRYRFAETRVFPPPVGVKEQFYRRFFRDPARASGKTMSVRDQNGNWRSVKRIVAAEEVTAPEARYGYTWRGVSRPHDRELGIAGGELIVLDTRTGEVLGLRRIFRLTGMSRQGTWWQSAVNCSTALASGGLSLLYDVLKPVAD
jgi:hypothetical protein